MKIEEFENTDGTISVRISGKPLTCIVCGNYEYHERKALLNTRSGELFNLAWAEKKATNYICAHCGYIFWFLR
jgi:predicted nucleic-acid-binding Zn-ribbon protein